MGRKPGLTAQWNQSELFLPLGHLASELSFLSLSLFFLGDWVTQELRRNNPFFCLHIFWEQTHHVIARNENQWERLGLIESVTKFVCVLSTVHKKVDCWSLRMYLRGKDNTSITSCLSITLHLSKDLKLLPNHKQQWFNVCCYRRSKSLISQILWA